MSDFKPRRPDWTVAVKIGKASGNVGRAWNNPDGHISIRFNPFVVIPTNDPELQLSLFPIDQPETEP